MHHAVVVVVVVVVVALIGVLNPGAVMQQKMRHWLDVSSLAFGQADSGRVCLCEPELYSVTEAS